MGALRLFTSNRLEIMAEALAEVLREPLASPFDPEIIIVQSQGMERWLSMQLATQHGICANCRFPFPNVFVHDIFRKVLKNIPEKSVFDPDVMTWRIMKILPFLVKKPGFEDLALYLGGAKQGLELFQLSERIGDTFDQYLLFRPGMIFRWESEADDHWQAHLWRELIIEGEANHRANLARSFFNVMESGAIGEKELPDRVSVFGISALPRFHVEVLVALSGYSEVNLFLMNPCKEYWGDILSSWEIHKRVARDGRPVSDALHVEKGNSLLASMGTLGRDFFDLINEFSWEEFPVFEAPGDGDLLSCIQSDILNLRDRSGGNIGKKGLSPDDHSIQIHSCHSPMREIEVLHDQLLHMFEVLPDLMPKDVLVMTPDIEAYAPYIQAVFDLPPEDRRRIPFSIADQSIRQESGIAETFFSILNLHKSRYGASEVMAVLESEAVRRRYGFTAENLERVRKWVRETRIRWGIDGENRGQMGLPPFSENTWRAGLARLLMGYAMPGEDEKMFGPLLPYDHVEGEDSRVLGDLVQFAEDLFAHVQDLAEPRSLGGWCKTLMTLLDSFFMADDDSEREVQAIRRTLHDLEAMQDLASFDDVVNLEIIKSHLAHALSKRGFGFGFMTGGVTCCAMLPMRSIPFKVICLVGMNGHAYPRQSKPLSFDLIARHPRPGDRSRRNDDRYLFLEAILSTREQLYISYVGQNIMDNSAVPPSVLVSELMDCIEQSFEIPGKSVHDHLVTKHRLQGFSPAYFRNHERLLSYSEEKLDIAEGLLERPGTIRAFISGGLSEPDETWQTIDLEALCRFFSNPAGFLLNKRLGIYLEEGVSIPEEREPFDIKGLDRYHLEERLLERRLEGKDLKDFLVVTRAAGSLPHGTVGECLYDSLRHGIESFAARLSPYMAAGLLEPLELDLHASGFRLTGRMDSLYRERLIHYRYARCRAKDLLRTWIYHVVLNALGVEGCPRATVLAALEPKRGQGRQWVAWEYEPVEDGKEILDRLLFYYREGLKKPLSLFPESSWTYASERLTKERSVSLALRRAGEVWEGSDQRRGEVKDPYYQLCFGERDALDEGFQSMAEEIFGPLLEHLQKLR